jgi:hypothetical protein
MSQSTSLIDFPDVVECILSDIAGALTSRRSMPEPRRLSIARTVRAMVLGLFPGDVMQLMLAGQAVLFHALTIDAAGDLTRESEGPPNARAHSVVANLSRTMSKNLDAFVRSRAESGIDVAARTTGPVASPSDRADLDEAFEVPPRDGDADIACDAGRDDAGRAPAGNPSEDFAETAEAVPAERLPAEPMSQRLFAGDVVSETAAANMRAAPLNRQQRRKQEREQARLARRSPG